MGENPREARRDGHICGSSRKLVGSSKWRRGDNYGTFCFVHHGHSDHRTGRNVLALELNIYRLSSVDRHINRIKESSRICRNRYPTDTENTDCWKRTRRDKNRIGEERRRSGISISRSNKGVLEGFETYAAILPGQFPAPPPLPPAALSDPPPLIAGATSRMAPPLPEPPLQHGPLRLPLAWIVPLTLIETELAIKMAPPPAPPVPFEVGSVPPPPAPPDPPISGNKKAFP